MPGAMLISHSSRAWNLNAKIRISTVSELRIYKCGWLEFLPRLDIKANGLAGKSL
jgi:hypothetical protein